MVHFLLPCTRSFSLGLLYVCVRPKAKKKTGNVRKVKGSVFVLACSEKQDEKAVVLSKPQKVLSLFLEMKGLSFSAYSIVNFKETFSHLEEKKLPCSCLFFSAMIERTGLLFSRRNYYFCLLFYNTFYPLSRNGSLLGQFMFIAH